MLHLFSLTLAVALAHEGCTFAAQLPLSDNSGLIDVYQRALDNNADLAAARSDNAARQEQVPQARAGLLPDLSAGAASRSVRTQFNQPATTFDRSGTAWQATLTQPVFHADRWFGLAAAQAVSAQATIQLAAVEQHLVLQTAEDYFSVLRVQDGLAAFKAEENALKRQLDQSQQRFSVGLSDQTDLAQAQAGYDTARANRIVGERQVDDAFERLTTLTNHPYHYVDGMSHQLPVVPPAPNDAHLWVDTAQQQNLTLQADDFAVVSAEQTLRQRQAGHAPTVDAVLAYQQGDNDSLGFTNPNPSVVYGGDVSQRSISLQVRIPLYSGGLISAYVREAYARLSETQALREGARRQVVEDTRNLHRAVNTDVEQVEARRQSIVSNQTAVQATQVGYQVGTRNIVDVLDAQRQLYNAVRDYNNSRYDYILDSLRLRQAVGTLAPSDLQALVPFLKSDYRPDIDFLPTALTSSARTSR